MANEVGTAANLEDLFGKIVTFVTTSPALVALGQQWEVLRIHRDNVAGVTSNLVEPTAVTARNIRQTFREDPRSIGNDDPDGSSTGAGTFSNYVPGTSFVKMELTNASDVKAVRISSPGSATIGMLQNFRLQYSATGASWTTALTVASNPTYLLNETKTFAVPGSIGAQKFWRIIIDRKSDGSASGNLDWKSLLLIGASGEILNHFGSEVLLKAPGMAGSEAIFTGIRSEYDLSNGWYNLFVNGYTGFDPNEKSWFEQPGALPHWRTPAANLNTPMIPCWNQTMPYWLAASGRSLRFGVKVSTSFEGGYLGFILPYASPAQYPYPLAVGGSLVPATGSRSLAWRYSHNNQMHSVFPIPGCTSSPTSTTESVSTTLYIRTPDGLWGYIGNRYSNSSDPNAIASMNQSLGPPFAQSGIWRGVWPTSVRDAGSGGTKRDYREVLGGGYIMQPLIIHQRGPIPAVWGELEGCYAISGFSNAAENTTVWQGVTHVIFQNVARTEVHEYWALALS